MLALGCAPFAIHAPAALAADPADEAALDRMSDAIFERLKAGDADGMVDVSLGRSPLMAGKEAERQNLSAQIETTTRIYGPVRSVEKVEQAGYGNLVVKRYYVAQHDKYVTRWELVFVKLPGGWAVSQLSFDDRAPSWMD
ncbi:hypothetical protein B2G71_00995 [Novosphingobium sp. PC22D]|nr:hypothetical protein B2G71_00995 [Novosphingobium sp. PC22D]